MDSPFCVLSAWLCQKNFIEFKTLTQTFDFARGLLHCAPGYTGINFANFTQRSLTVRLNCSVSMKPIQLPLGVRLRDDATFINYYPGANAAALGYVERLCEADAAINRRRPLSRRRLNK